MSTRRIRSLAWLCALAVSPALALGQQAAEPSTDVSAVTPALCCQLPDGAIIELETLEPISSARAKRGDHFRLRTTQAITVSDVLVLPAGTEGIGEVIHADKARGGGKPGELLLAARFLQLDGRTVPLRGMQLGRSGKDTTQASLAVSLALGPFGLFVQGGEVVIPVGTAAHAKLKGAFAHHPAATPAPVTDTPQPFTESPDNAVSTPPQKE
jgi:hypothetical protein